MRTVNIDVVIALLLKGMGFGHLFHSAPGHPTTMSLWWAPPWGGRLCL